MRSKLHVFIGAGQVKLSLGLAAHGLGYLLHLVGTLSIRAMTHERLIAVESIRTHDAVKLSEPSVEKPERRRPRIRRKTASHEEALVTEQHPTPRQLPRTNRTERDTARRNRHQPNSQRATTSNTSAATRKAVRLEHRFLQTLFQ